MKTLRSIATGLASLAFLALTTAPSFAGGFLYIHNGPDGEVQIQTPWGDYAAYDEGGGLYWVGTQKEFDHARVTGIMRADGGRESMVKSSPDVAGSYVEADSFRTRVGSDIILDEIVPEIAFDMTATGHTTKTHHVLDVIWIQATDTLVYCFVYDKKTHTFYESPNENANGMWRDVAFALPNDLFKRPITLVFMSKDRKPGVIGVPSLTKWDYKYIKDRLAEQPGGEHDTKQLRSLLKFDPTLASAH